MLDESAMEGKGRTYDVQVYNIVKYFRLLMDNNPNMIDSIFTPVNCVLHSTRIGNLLRDNRKMFLHKGAWHKFKGYAYSQLHKMTSKTKTGPRAKDVEDYGYDRKFAYHIIRLMDEVEQIMTEGDIDLQRNREQLKTIRRGEWTEEQIKEHFARKERDLESLYTSSSLPHGPPKERIKKLLMDCLEEHYGNLDKCIVKQDELEVALREIETITEKALKNR